ncbi:uncharacterized protein LOC130623722 [Hydractinia symbiolongicarpus]|uniref:uncharacterized protein LOC130623722 n=1 Tax=Hydractinia symbiolongicarpus TaxID=13093 RepID=UPI00254C744D|nr:uncharacterized protein LOC130623722 [Hydractinia symbiolongicarpus]
MKTSKHRHSCSAKGASHDSKLNDMAKTSSFLPYSVRSATTRKKISSPSLTRNPCIRKMPTKALVSPYTQNSSLLKKCTQKCCRKHDVNALEKCYKRVCKDDVSAFRLLFRNQNQFGKEKIILQVKPDNMRHQNILLKKQINPNSFPPKKPPYVPASFSNGAKKKKITARFIKGKEKSSVKNEKFQTLTANHLVDDRNKPTRRLSHQRSDSSLEHLNSIDKKVGKGSEKMKNSVDPKIFDEINQEILRKGTVDEELINVPNSGDFFTDSRCSSSASRIIENHIKGHVKSDSTRFDVDWNSTSNESRNSQVSDENIAASGAFIKCEIDMHVVDENGEMNKPEVFIPDTDHKSEEETATTNGDCSPARLSRREELVKLLNECSEIAKEIKDLKLQS